VKGARVVQRHVLYLGEINDAQRAAWCKSLEVLEEDGARRRQMAIFPEDREAPELSCAVVRVKLEGMRLERARQWGACWLGLELWKWLELDGFWASRLVREVEQAFKELKTDLAIRPIYHQKDSRIEAHIFVAFIAYCLQVTLKARLTPLAGGLTPRAVLEKFAAMQMLDVHLPTTDARELVLTRYTEPDADLRLLLAHMKLRLPQQPPPKIRAPRPDSRSQPSRSQPCISPCSADLGSEQRRLNENQSLTSPA
jgi:hypothetical protein